MTTAVKILCGVGVLLLGACGGLSGHQSITGVIEVFDYANTMGQQDSVCEHIPGCHGFTTSLSEDQVDAYVAAFTEEYDGYDCSTGYGSRFPDIMLGATVLVRDGSGTIIAKGAVGHGAIAARQGPPGNVIGPMSNSACVFEVAVADVPKADFYSLQVGSHDGPAYSHQELEEAGWRIDLQLGR